MCGLFGFISSKGDILINKKDFITLGIFNDVRGGDSVGILAGSQVEYGIAEQKFFANFYKTSKILQNLQASPYLLGHTRKASVGAVSLENAQPIVIQNEQDPSLIDFVLFHNGTIKNHLALANKYLPHETFINVTDTYVMAQLFYNCGFNICKEYIGAGVFIAVDYREDRNHPTITFFKGASANTELVTAMYEERPLYYYNTPNGFWYSSIQSSLDLLAFTDPHAKVLNFPCNTIISYKNGKEISKIKCSRVGCMQSTAYGSDNVIIEDYLATRKSFNNTSYPSTRHTASKYEMFDNQIDDDLIYGLTAYHLPYSTNGYTINEIQFEDGLYMYNGEYAHGPLNLSPSGKGNFDNFATINSSTYYFFQGVLLYGKTIFDALCAIQHDFGMTAEDLYKFHTYMIYWKSPMAVEFDDMKYYVYSDSFAEIPKNGLWYALLTAPTYSYLFDNGKVTKRFMVSQASRDSALDSFHFTCQKVEAISDTELYDTLIENIILP